MITFIIVAFAFFTLGAMALVEWPKIKEWYSALFNDVMQKIADSLQRLKDRIGK